VPDWEEKMLVAGAIDQLTIIGENNVEFGVVATVKPVRSLKWGLDQQKQ
jgi:hypothetical protein